MIALKDIQTDVKTVISAAGYFAGETVIEDRGQQKKEIEDTLRTRGFVVVVPPVLSGKVNNAAGGTVVVDTDVFIQILVNPAVNSSDTGAGKDLYLAMASAIAALIEKNPNNSNDRYKLKADGEAIELSSFDPGLWAYDVSFTKLALV